MQVTEFAVPVIEPLGDCALTVHFGDPASSDVRRFARRFAERLLERLPAGVYDVSAGYGAVGIFYSPLALRMGVGKTGLAEMPLDWLAAELKAIWNALKEEALSFSAHVVELPVCYGGEYGPDLEEMAKARGMTAAEAIRLHAGTEYEVQMIGFVPGFPYLSGLPEALHSPRRATPRLTVPAGSVGIGGAQTGVYPMEIPGGWQLIGRTPLRLFDPHRDPPCLLAAGDFVRFVPIDEPEFRRLQQSTGDARDRTMEDGGEAPAHRPVREAGASGAEDPSCEAGIGMLPNERRPGLCGVTEEYLSVPLGGAGKGTPVAMAEFRREGERLSEPAVGAGNGRPAGGQEWAQVAIRSDESAVDVVEPGLQTLVQDLGRPGCRRYGVPLGGALDPYALRTANLLVGNAEGAPALEATLLGPTLRFAADTLIALAGARCDARLGGVPLPHAQPVLAAAGSTLALGAVTAGCRAYLAVAGGIAVRPVLGSAGTYARAALGGVAGRALRAGDRLRLGPPTALAARLQQRLPAQSGPAPALPWRAASGLCPLPGRCGAVVRVVPGAERGRFAPEALRAFAGEAFALTPQADRMGARLNGPPLRLAQPFEPASEPVAPGSVQVPPDGQPIVLLADGQTTGGYPRLAHVVTADLPLVAQSRPGDRLRFREVTLDEAHELLRVRESDMALFRLAIEAKGRNA